MKRVMISLILVTLFCLSFGNAGIMPTQAQEQYTLQVYQYPHWTGLTGKETWGMSPDDPRRGLYTATDWLELKAKEFEKLYPKAKIKIELLSWARGRRKVDVLIAAGNPPDMLAEEDSSTIMKYAYKGLIAPVNDWLTEEDLKDFYKISLETAQIGDEYYLFPFVGEGRMILANKKIFNERGLINLLPSKGDRKWTYDEFLKAAQKTTFDQNGDGKIDVYGFGASFKQGPGDYCNHSVFLWGWGAKMFDETGTKFILNCPEAVKGLQFLKDLQDKYKVMPLGSALMGEEELSQIWFQGKLAMQNRGSNGSAKALEDAKAQGLLMPGVVDLYPVMYPSDPPHEPVAYTCDDGFGIFKQEDPEKLDLLMKFGYYCTNKQNIRAVKGMYGLPWRKSAGDLYEGDQFEDFTSFVVKALNYSGKDTFNRFYVPLRQFTIPMYQAVLTGEKTPKEALEETSRKANEFMQREL